MTTLIIGGTGKTGSRVTRLLQARGIPVRPVSRRTTPRFDWTEPDTWPAATRGASAAYLTFQPDLGLPGADEIVGAFAEHAVAAGVLRLVLLSGRGEEGARRSEQALQASGADWTVLRSAFFMQNFTESAWADELAAGELAMVHHTVGEPFIDVEDIAQVAVAALTDESHVRRTYELTGPRLLTFAEVAAEFGAAAGRAVQYVDLEVEAYRDHLVDAGLSTDVATGLAYLFDEVLDGRNAHLTTDVRDVLGRPPRDLTEVLAEAMGRREASYG